MEREFVKLHDGKIYYQEDKEVLAVYDLLKKQTYVKGDLFFICIGFKGRYVLDRISITKEYRGERLIFLYSLRYKSCSKKRSPNYMRLREVFSLAENGYILYETEGTSKIREEFLKLIKDWL